MANKKTSSSASTKKTTSSAKKTSTKKVAPKTSTKKENKKVETKVAKVETKVAKVEPKTKIENKKEVKKTNFITWLKDNYVVIGLIIIAILLIVNIIIVVSGHKAKLVDGNEVIASIDGKDFIADDLFDKLKETNGSDTLLNLVDSYISDKELSDTDKKDAKKTAKENIASIREQYESYGYTWEDVLSQYGYENEDALLDEFLLSTEKELVAKNFLKSDLKEEDIKEYYNNNVYGTYTAKHILIVPDTNDEMSDEEKENAENDAKKKAEEVISKLKDGAEWSDLVKEYSEDEGSVDDEGLIENFTKGDVVDEFFDAVEALKDGKYTKEPVKSSYGYHVIYRVSYTEKESYKKMKDELVEKIVDEKLSEDTNLYTSTWANIRKKYNFTINDTIIKNAYESAIK